MSTDTKNQSEANVVQINDHEFQAELRCTFNYKNNSRNYGYPRPNTTLATTRGIFKIGYTDKREYYLEIKESDEFYLYLHLISYEKKDIQSSVELSCLCDESEKIHEIFAGPTLGYPMVKELNIKKYNCDDDDDDDYGCTKAYEIICKIKFRVKERSKNKTLIRVPNFKEDFDYFGTLFKEEKFCDCTLIAKDVEFKVHRIILSVCSCKFAEIFNTNSKKNEVQFEISDLEPDVLRMLLIFIYERRVENIEESAFHLYDAADKYCLKELKTICKDAICVMLEMENVIDTMVFANNYEDNEIKTTSLKFIKNNLNTIIKTERFQELKNSDPEILEIIIVYLATSENDVPR